MSKQCVKPRTPKECAQKLPQVINYMETQNDVPISLRQIGTSHVVATAVTKDGKTSTITMPDHPTGIGLGIKIFKWLASIGLVGYLLFHIREFLLNNVVNGLTF